MTNEEIQRTMEFIIKQQESFAESMERADERITRLERALIGIVDIVTETVRELRGLAAQVEELVEKVGALTDRLGNTDDRLNIFITTVERYISEKQNGEASS
jgi:chromosome segregation ATPase